LVFLYYFNNILVLWGDSQWVEQWFSRTADSIYLPGS